MLDHFFAGVGFKKGEANMVVNMVVPHHDGRLRTDSIAADRFSAGQRLLLNPRCEASFRRYWEPLHHVACWLLGVCLAFSGRRDGHDGAASR
jgi:hypothetical protein